MARLVYRMQIVGYLDMRMVANVSGHWYSLMISIHMYNRSVTFLSHSDTINKRHLIIHRCFFDRCVTKIWSTTMNQKLECLCLSHSLRTHNCYFPYSFRPISYLGYIWVRSEKQSFFVEKKALNDENHGQGTHRAKMRADKFGRKHPKIY